ncbi:hypothetical protein AB0H88_22795 [Nonomuraea sp. NPDC050680]|uniref:hypothetical protein n=1 Tax=Nonomuraea sp. NPDC050680 TaxID=3154630 RepID=UPI0033D72853
MGKVAVEINGMLVYVRKESPNVYLVEAHTDMATPERVTASILTTDLMFAWTYLIEELADRGWGHVIAYDAMIKTHPRWSRSLGRIDGPTKHPNPLRHTPADGQ